MIICRTPFRISFFGGGTDYPSWYRLHIEQDVLQETVGSQDQVLAAFGGVKHVQFQTDGEITVAPLVLPAERVKELKAHLMLFYTGIARTAADVARSYAANLESRRR